MRRCILSGILGLMMLGLAAPAKAQGPVAGQPYQIPAEYGGYAPGSVINYGGYSYVIQADGTMLLAQDQPYTSSYVQPGYTPSYVQPGYTPYYVQPGYTYWPYYHHYHHWYGPGYYRPRHRVW